METASREVATVAAASLVLDQLSKIISDKHASNNKLSVALVPVFVIRWTAATIRKISGRRLCGILALLRNSNLSAANYKRVSQFWKNAFRNGCLCFPNDWGVWRSLLERFDLDDATPLRERMPPVQWCIDQELLDPRTLARASFGQIGFLTGASPTSPLVLRLWRDAVVVYATPTDGQVSDLEASSANAESLIRSIRGTDLESSHATKRVTVSMAKLEVKKPFLDLGPSEKMKLLRQKNIPQRHLGNFFRRQSQLLAIRGIKKTFPPFCSGISSYFSFCELKAGQGRYHFATELPF